jgi:hypothetical protein
MVRILGACAFKSQSSCPSVALSRPIALPDGHILYALGKRCVCRPRRPNRLTGKPDAQYQDLLTPMSVTLGLDASPSLTMAACVYGHSP